MNDLTRLLQTLQPTPDGESAVRHRTALVDAVNADGTVDLDFDGTIIPDVSVLDGAVVNDADVVQVIAWAGDLLVLGAARTAPSGARGVVAYAQVTSSQTGVTTETNLTGLSLTFVAAAGRRYRLSFHGDVSGDAVNSRVRVRLRDLTVVLSEGLAINSAVNFDATLHESVVLTPGAGSVTWLATLQPINNATNARLVATATNPAYIMAEDIGPA